MVSVATSTNEQWAKYIWLKQDFSRNISIKVLSKYLQLLGSKCIFFFNFPHYKSWHLTQRGNFHTNTKSVKANMMNISTKSQSIWF